MCLCSFVSRADHEDDRWGGCIAVKIIKFGSAKSFNKFDVILTVHRR